MAIFAYSRQRCCWGDSWRTRAPAREGAGASWASPSRQRSTPAAAGFDVDVAAAGATMTRLRTRPSASGARCATPPPAASSNVNQRNRNSEERKRERGKGFRREAQGLLHMLRMRKLNKFALASGISDRVYDVRTLGSGAWKRYAKAPSSVVQKKFKWDVKASHTEKTLDWLDQFGTFIFDYIFDRAHPLNTVLWEKTVPPCLSELIINSSRAPCRKRSKLTHAGPFAPTRYLNREHTKAAAEVHTVLQHGWVSRARKSWCTGREEVERTQRWRKATTVC